MFLLLLRAEISSPNAAIAMTTIINITQVIGSIYPSLSFVIQMGSAYKKKKAPRMRCLYVYAAITMLWMFLIFVSKPIASKRPVI